MSSASESPMGSSLASTASQISKLSASPPISEASSPTVLVVGGGVSGLLAGVALSAAGCDAHIYEQAAASAPASASADVAFLVTEELQQFFAAQKVPLARKVFRTAGRQVLAEDGDVQVQDGTEQEYISWSALRSALLQRFPADHYHAGAKVVAVDDGHADFVVIELENGERIAGHMLVAADGVRSVVRQHLLPNCHPSYSGYLAWRGVVQLDRLSPGTQHLLADKSSMYKGPNLHMQVHPLPMADGNGEGQPLVWTWFNNQAESELPGLLLDHELRHFPHAVPLRHLSPAVADAVATAASQALPQPLAELVSSSTNSMAVAAVSDMALPCQAMGRVVFVGEAGCVVRPHGCSSAAKAAMDAASLAASLRTGKLSVDKALPAWDASQVQKGVVLCRAAAAAGNRLQGTEEAC